MLFLQRETEKVEEREKERQWIGCGKIADK